MAVMKIWQVYNRLDKVLNYATNPDKTVKEKRLYTDDEYEALKDVLSYAADEEKTEQEFYVSGINCIGSNARNQFVNTKLQFNKTDGIQAYHAYMSFPPDEVTPDLAHEIGLEFARRVWGDKYQVLVTTHLNTKCLHNHFVVNSVSFVDGKRLTDKDKAWFYLHHIADDICKEYGLSVIKEPDRNRPPNHIVMQDRTETFDTPTRHNMIRQVIDDAIENSTSMTQFKMYLNEAGYKYKMSENLKYWTVLPKGYHKSVRLYRLGEEYTNARIKERIAENRSFLCHGKPYHYEIINVPDDIRKKKGSLYNLYLYYCYKLGYLPKKHKPNSMKVHFLLREDLIQIDKLNAETELLCKYHIDTDEQLFFHIESLKSEVGTLDGKRADLRKTTKLRSADEQTISNAKNSIKELSKQIKDLKNEIALCEDIAQRSHLMWEKLEQVELDEQARENNDKNERRKLRYE